MVHIENQIIMETCSNPVTAGEAKLCSNHGCDQPATKSCSACKIALYCGVICQTADWPHHKEECPGHLRKVGKAHLTKAKGFHQQQNWVQSLRYGEIAATNLKQLKDRRLETVEAIDKALSIKFDALQFLGRHSEVLECIKECYTLWAMNHMRNPGSMRAASALIQSCLNNEEYEDAERYARHAYFMIVEMTDNFIPSDEQPWFLAEVSHWLALAIYRLAATGGIPPTEQQKVGKEAIEHARKALEMHTQLCGTESSRVAGAMGSLADILNHFNDIDDDALRLFEQSISLFRLVEGSLSMNVGVNEFNLGNFFRKRAERAEAASDLDRELANAELALLHFRESARIYSSINHVDKADDSLRHIATTEENIRQIGIARTSASTVRRG